MSDSFKKLIGMLMHHGIVFDYDVDFFGNDIVSHPGSAGVWRIRDDLERQQLFCVVNATVFIVPYDSCDDLSFVIERITKYLTSR